MGCAVLHSERHLDLSCLVLQRALKLSETQAAPLCQGAALICLCIFFFSFSGGITCWCCVFMNVLTIFMVEGFYIYAVVQFYFFLQEKV